MKKLISILFCLLIWSCNMGSKPEFKQANRPDLFDCPEADMELIKEAVYTFEDYLGEGYGFLSKGSKEGYANYIKLLVDDRAPAKEFFDDHLVAMRDYLLEQDEFWTEKNGLLHLNYDHPLVGCALDEILDDQLRENIKSLVASNTVSPKLMAPLLFRKRNDLPFDRGLGTYICFEFFFPKLFEMESPDYIDNVDRVRPAEDMFPDPSIQ